MIDFDAGVAQFLDAAGGDFVRIAHGDDDARDAGGDDGVDAGRRAAVVGARFERDDHRRAAGVDAAQRFDLRVRFAGAVMPSLGDHVSVAHDDAADHRIRADGVAAARGELEGAAHEVFHAGDCPTKKPAIARRLSLTMRLNLGNVDEAVAGDATAPPRPEDVT